MASNSGRDAGFVLQHFSISVTNPSDVSGRSGILGRLCSSTGDGMSVIRDTYDALTEHKLLYHLVIKHGPWQVAVGQDLDAHNRERIHVHLGRHHIVSTNELGRLPS